MPRCWQYEKMKPADLAAAIKVCPVAYLVISPLEWHGEAMAFGCDPAIGAAIARKAWRKTGGVLIPTMYYGVETLFREWNGKGWTDHWGMEVQTKEHHPGSIYCTPTILELMVKQTLSFIEHDGFKVCAVVSGHGGWEHVAVLKDLEKRWQGRPMKMLYSKKPGKPLPKSLRFEGSGGHADFAEASILGAVDPSMVDKKKFGRIRRDKGIGLKRENVRLIDYRKGRAVVEFEVSRLSRAVSEALRRTR
jgi:creatinine amidohydrolase